MGDPLSPPSVDSDYVNRIYLWGFLETGPEGPFLEFFKADLQSRVWVSKKGTCELANLVSSINYDRPSSSNLSFSPILPKDDPKDLFVKKSLRNTPLAFTPQC
ncbi:hypothetical protein AMTRI_Chr06g195370 [Amborella trichopoda]